MQSERILSEIKSISQKYSRVVFELEKCKDTVKKLTVEKDELLQEHKKCEEVITKLTEEKELASTQLKEAMKKIDSLASKIAESNKSDSKNITPRVKSVSPKNLARGTREIRQLKEQQNVLLARLKQAECGIKRNDAFKRKVDNLSKDDGDFEVEKIINHKKQRGGKILFMIRWKGYGPEFDSWEPQSNLNCPAILQNYIRLHKI